MVKIKTSGKQKISSKKEVTLIDQNQLEERKPLEYLLNEDNIARAIAECLAEHDFEGIAEVLKYHFKAVKRSKLMQTAEQQHSVGSYASSDSFSTGATARIASSLGSRSKKVS